MDGSAVLKTAADVTRILEALGIPHSIGGSIASMVAGEPRSTIDVDIAVDLDESKVPDLVSALSTAYYVDERALRRAIREQRATNLVHNDTLVKVDLFVVGDGPLDRQQIERRLTVMLDGHTLFVHSGEDILLQKMLWFRRGGGVSDRQWRDILAIVRVQGARLDLEYLRASARFAAIEDLLQRALREGAHPAAT
jgi:hypothetical protein